MNVIYATAILLLSTSAVFAQGDDFQPVWVDSLKKCVTGNTGSTAKQVYTISAGPDRVFIPETIKFIENSKGGKRQGISFVEAQYEMVDVKATVNGRDYKIPIPTKIVVELYAETGSGRIGTRCAWYNGYIHAETMEVE